MKIIDFEKKGNMVRFYLGKDDLKKWYGDDWDDAPYDCNAGIVYDEYVSGHRDIVFPFDSMVLEPCDGNINCNWCKDDMVKRHVPCIIVVPAEIGNDFWWGNDFAHWVGADGIIKFYFGDQMEAEENDP